MNTILCADAYEYSMFDRIYSKNLYGRDSIFNLSVRDVGDKILLNAGVIDAIQLISSLKGNASLCDYLYNSGLVTNERALTYLYDYSFKGEIHILPEGSLFSSYTPQLKVYSKFEDAQLFESLILQVVNMQTTVATAARNITKFVISRDKNANGAEFTFIEGASRRARGVYDSMMVSKAARIGGFDKTTNVMYAKTIGENPVGTIGHSFILSYDSESSAFDAIVSYALEHHLKYPTFLVDTYEDVLNSATMAIEKASLAGFSKVGIRIDSGNLLEQARLILSIGDRYNVRVAFTFSDNLNEKSIPEIYEFYQETRCDVAVLVGTQLAQPADIVKAVYKVSEIDSRLVCKRSSDVSKRTLSGDIQVYRQHSGYFYLDVVSNDVQYNGTGLPILIPAYSTIRELPKPVVSSSVDFTTNSIKVQLDVK